MSRGTSSQLPPPPKADTAICDDDKDMLEGLQGLNIKNFNDWYLVLTSFFPTILMPYPSHGTGPDTPSSTNASLPTPTALRSSQVFLATDLYVSSSYLFSSFSLMTFHSTGSSWLSVPNAPLLKDSDSFTDGTGHSTFDFNLPANGNDINPSTIYPLIYHPKCDIDSDDDDDFGPVSSPTQTMTYTNSLALDLLPRPGDRQDAVRAWVEGVSTMSMQAHDHHLDEESQQLRKRRRSLTASSEAEARRVRAWSPTKEPSHAPQPGARKGTYPARRQDLEAPD